MNHELTWQAMEKLDDAAGERCGCNITSLPEWKQAEDALLTAVDTAWVGGYGVGAR